MHKLLGSVDAAHLIIVGRLVLAFSIFETALHELQSLKRSIAHGAHIDVDPVPVCTFFTGITSKHIFEKFSSRQTCSHDLGNLAQTATNPLGGSMDEMRRKGHTTPLAVCTNFSRTHAQPHLNSCTN